MQGKQLSKSDSMGLQEAAAGDFPGGPAVKNLPCSAKDAGLISGQGTKIPHATEQLSLSHNYGACRESVCHSKRSHVAKTIPYARSKTQCSQLHKKKKQWTAGTLFQWVFSTW